MRPNYKKRGDIMQKNNNRFNRVEEEMKKEISNIISNKLKNPDVTGLIRSEVAKSINLRNTPDIIFELDDSMEYGAKIDSILKDIMKDVKPENEGEE